VLRASPAGSRAGVACSAALLASIYASAARTSPCACWRSGHTSISNNKSVYPCATGTITMATSLVAASAGSRELAQRPRLLALVLGSGYGRIRSYRSALSATTNTDVFATGTVQACLARSSAFFKPAVRQGSVLQIILSSKLSQHPYRITASAACAGVAGDS